MSYTHGIIIMSIAIVSLFFKCVIKASAVVFLGGSISVNFIGF